VALDRQSIEKKDFPVGRRGYDPEAVDNHLSVLADEIDDFKRVSRRRSDTLASSASEQVRAIVEAAETSAADIQREAEAEAREIREEANNEARATRDQAHDQARDYVGKVTESTSTMLQRLDAMQQEMDTLIESLRSGSNRLNADLQLLETDLAGVADATVPRRFEPETGGESESEPSEGEPEPTDHFDAPAASDGHEPEEHEDDGSAPEAVEFEHVTAEAEYTYDPENPTPVAEESDDAEGARLIALNMALNGTPREETARYLSENFQLSDAGGLLDEVYASVEG
jgi:DivIVA domain-containing protein